MPSFVAATSTSLRSLPPLPPIPMYFLLYFLCILQCLAFPILESTERSSIYIIRHAEKSADGTALSKLGMRRAMCLSRISADINITSIIVPRTRKNGGGVSSLRTAEPIARDLGLEIDSSCRRNDMKCAAKLARRKRKHGNVLVIWRHSRIGGIAELLGAEEGLVVCPDDTYDLIWTIVGDTLISMTRQDCPDLEGDEDEDEDSKPFLLIQ